MQDNFIVSTIKTKFWIDGQDFLEVTIKLGLLP